LHQLPEFSVGQYVQVINSDGSLIGPYLVEEVDEDSCTYTLSEENGNPAFDGRSFTQAELRGYD